MVDLFYDPGYEPNNSLDTAARLTEGEYLIAGEGVDWYRIDALSGAMSFSMTPAQAVNLNMELYNAQGQVVRTAFTPTGSESFTHLAAEDATWYLRVYRAQFGDTPPPGLQNDYSLALDLPEADPVLPGDSQATAPLLSEGVQSFTGLGVDWHRIETLSGRVLLTMTPQAGVNLNLELADAQGRVVATGFQPAGQAETVSYLMPADGVLYARVYNAAWPGTPPNGTQLNYSLALDLPEADPVLPGDSQATAPLLSEGVQSFTGLGVDWHRIETLSGRVLLTMTPQAGVNLNLELADAQGRVVATGFQPAGQAETVSYLMPADGVLYARVYNAAWPGTPPNGTQLNYSLALDLPEATVRGPNDPGETLETATLLTHGTRAVTGTGLDWFRVEIGPGVAQFTMTPTGGSAAQDLNLALFDDGGNAIATNHTTTGSETFRYLVPAQGTYFLQVSNAAYPQGTPNGVNMTYSLTADLPQGSWSRVLPFGPVGNASVGIYDLDGDGRDEIVLGTSKALDAKGNELRPAGLIVLEDDGAIKWTKTFPAVSFTDPVTGKLYQTTSISTAPVFSDVNGDGRIDIVVGLGAADGFDPDGAGPREQTVGQPGDRGGIAALDADGNLLWFFQTGDSFGNDGRPDGVYGAPVVFDLDGDGVREVVFASWDHYLYVLDGRTGAMEKRADLHDTAGASPTVADLNNDGRFEIVMPADITDNAAAGLPRQGGILHVFNSDLQQTVMGWTTQIGTSTNADFRGKFEEQSMWSTAQVADVNRDGILEIVVGTGNFFKDGRGEYVRVWNADGTLRLTLPTVGRTLAAPLLADLDGDGRSEIVSATLDGQVHAWRADGSQIFSTRMQPHGSNPTEVVPIRRAPVAVDLDDDGKLEILVSVGSQTMILNSAGRVLTDPLQPQLLTLGYQGSPVVRDIDRDGRVDIVVGGNTATGDQAVVHRFENPLSETAHAPARIAKYQESQNLHEVRAFVERFYGTILGRASDAAGSNSWTDALASGTAAGADVARGFTASREFTQRGLSDEPFVRVLYQAFFNRPADAGGLAGWMSQLQSGVSRAAVVDGFVGSREFTNLAASFGIRARALDVAVSDLPEIVGDPHESDILRGGSGDSIIHDGQGLGKVIPEQMHGQVYRLYGATLGRVPDPGGFMGWLNGLASGSLQLEQVAGAFVASREFQRVYGALDDAGFVALLYRNVLGRQGSDAEIAGWLDRMDGENGLSRAAVVVGFSESREYGRRTMSGLDEFMRMTDQRWNDVIEGGAGNDSMNGGLGSDTFIFRKGQGGADVIEGFEAWDNLQLSGFGLRTAEEARARMTQVGADVVFDAQGQTIRFTDTLLSDMARVRFNLS